MTAYSRAPGYLHSLKGGPIVHAACRNDTICRGRGGA